MGYILGKRGHTCVNGAGAFGCMAAMNDGCYAADGYMVGVIHEMWLSKADDALRDGGAHFAFSSTENAVHNDTTAAAAANDAPDGPSMPSKPHRGGSQFASTGSKKKREILVARGKDLQERKRMLVENADALVVLPGGPGTWDELWEMACARGIGLTDIPIVCINCNGFYDPFRIMLQRAYDDKLTKLQPHELVHFEASAQEAVRWVEKIQSDGCSPPKAVPSRESRSMVLRTSSFFHFPLSKRTDSWVYQSLHQSISKTYDWVEEQPSWLSLSLMFVAGLTIGAIGVSTMADVPLIGNSNRRYR